MITTALVFDHRKRAVDVPGPIEVRITKDRKTFYISTGIKVRKSDFVAGTIVNVHDALYLRARLNIIYNKIQEEINRCIEDGSPLEPKRIRAAAWQAAESLNSSATPFIDWFEEQIPLLGMKSGTVLHYKTVAMRLRQCSILCRWEDLTVENICKFDIWIKKLRKPQTEAEKKMQKNAELICEGTVYNYHKCLKALINRALLFGMTEKNPYDYLRGKFKRGDRESVEYLTEQQMMDFESLNPPAGSNMSVAHDLFIFQMYTGLSYSDLQTFDISLYKKNGDEYVYIGERIKTGVPYVSHLLPPAVEILKKYCWEIPRIGNADYNHCLKALGMVAGIPFPLHSHVARHTFATFMLRNGVRIENVSKMLGHTNIIQTQRYAKVLAESVHDDFRKISKIITKQKRQ